MAEQSVTDSQEEFIPGDAKIKSKNALVRNLKEGAKVPHAAYGKRNPDAWILERQQRLYMNMMHGQTTRQCVLKHAQREGIAESTAWKDWKVVEQWVVQDFIAERETILPRLNAMRMQLIEKSIRRGMLGIANAAIDSLGRACGELSQEQAAAQMPTLQISVENAVISNKKAPELPEAGDGLASA